MWRANEDDASNGVDQELIAMQLFIRNAKCLFQYCAPEAVTNKEYGSMLILDM